jgi:tRNA(adenine34) deaminase
VNDDERYMREALKEAQRALELGEVPVGAVAVRDGVIIARGHNLRETRRDPTAHAEMLALQQASQVLHGWRLLRTTLYCTLEPCAMCAAAMVHARLPRLVYGAPDPKMGAAGSVLNLTASPLLNHSIEVTGGVLAEEAGAMLARFFARLRSTTE